MESVNAWLHASALPKGLKQRIRAYYAGGCPGTFGLGQSLPSHFIWSAPGEVPCILLWHPTCRRMGAARSSAGQSLGAVPGAAAHAAPRGGVGGQPPPAGPLVPVQARAPVGCQQHGSCAMCAECFRRHMVLGVAVFNWPRAPAQSAGPIHRVDCTARGCRELDEEQRFALSSALVPLDLTPGGWAGWQCRQHL